MLNSSSSKRNTILFGLLSNALRLKSIQLAKYLPWIASASLPREEVVHLPEGWHSKRRNTRRASTPPRNGLAQQNRVFFFEGFIDRSIDRFEGFCFWLFPNLLIVHTRTFVGNKISLASGFIDSLIAVGVLGWLNRDGNGISMCRFKLGMWNGTLRKQEMDL